MAVVLNLINEKTKISIDLYGNSCKIENGVNEKSLIGKEDAMFPNLEAEIARARTTKTKLARKMGITLGTLSLKLSGKSDLSLPEAKKIKKILKVNIPLEELFHED